MNIENIKPYFEIAAYIAGVLSILFLALQVRRERKLQEYKMLLTLEEKFTELLWKGSEVEGLDKVWKPLPEERQSLLDSKKDECCDGSWKVWPELSDPERNCYRFTRSGLEIMEQAYIANREGWIDNDEISEKWKGWASSWKKTNPFLPYVMAELEDWYTPSFVKYIKELP